MFEIFVILLLPVLIRPAHREVTKIELEDGWCLELMPYYPEDPEADRFWWELKDPQGKCVAELCRGDLIRIVQALQVDR